MRTTYGSKLYENFIPDDDDVVVERLRAADAIILGKTNASEFGYGGFGHNPVFPTTRNPWDPSLTPGGSSAGSAAAVASRMCPIAIGSDGGGSIRLPAAFCGLVGIKASMGRVPVWPGCRDPRFPGASGWESIEHIGPLARSVIDATLMLDVIAGPDSRDRLSIPDEGVGWIRAASWRPGKLDLKVAYCPDWGGVRVDRRVRALVDRAVGRFENDLACIVTIEKAPFGDFIDCFRAIVALETDIVGMRALGAGRKDDLSPSVRALLSKSWSAESFTDAITARKKAVRAMAQFMARFDLILTPTVPTSPFAIDMAGPGRIESEVVADDAWTPALYPANLTGQPAASIPAGWTDDGLTACRSANHRAAPGGSDCGRGGRGPSRPANRGSKSGQSFPASRSCIPPSRAIANEGSYIVQIRCGGSCASTPAISRFLIATATDRERRGRPRAVRTRMFALSVDRRLDAADADTQLGACLSTTGGSRIGALPVGDQGAPRSTATAQATSAQ